ncbi:hypothetical protein [Mycobacteroides abscessus]|uniref:hypothetical protein n=1 Tax=Mycobacteroides abscessus TaxID=36809 RepID=UPI00092C5011|nr:hypothetical protein [Mycobacteroides abscessus]SIK93246.1 Uncharacterised protein [Mycobacteroides abscessus subsp. abscessus]SIN02134.1 Uncharacterised protein [Mycobacteroides abscessus subsp. abscessus]SIN10372.1 Uncharacterised protein [Mycobacteroides abscessus subsp. abscessus]
MPAERFNEQRRAWIAAHEGVWLFQKRRAELLNKANRARSRAAAGAVPDPHDDKVTPPWLFRKPSLDWWVLGTCALAAPIGWPLGWLLYRKITTLIPEKLQAFPIPAAIWGAVISGAPLLVFTDPGPSIWSALVVPWINAQIPATFLAVGLYGVLEGWLAVDGSSEWWPMTPPPPQIDDTLLLGMLEVPSVTLLDPPRRKRDPVAPRRYPAKVHWPPILIGLALAAAGTLWYAIEITSANIGDPFSTFSAITSDRSTHDSTGF